MGSCGALGPLGFYEVVESYGVPWGCRGGGSYGVPCVL